MTSNFLSLLPRLIPLSIVTIAQSAGGNCESATAEALRKWQEERYADAAALYLAAARDVDPHSSERECGVLAIREVGRLCGSFRDRSKERRDCFEAALAEGARFGLDDTRQYDVLNATAIELFREGRYREAYDRWSRMLPHAEEMDSSGVEASMVLYQLAKSQLELSDFVEAERLFRDALGRQVLALGKDHYSTLSTLDGLATLYERSGDLRQAEHLLRDLLERYIRLFGASHPNVKSLSERLDRVLKMQ